MMTVFFLNKHCVVEHETPTSPLAAYALRSHGNSWAYTWPIYPVYVNNSTLMVAWYA